jgi:hypothetical protein
MVAPNRYVLGGNEEIYFTPKDQDGIFFVPSEMRLSIEDPQGVIATVSGAGITTASGYYSYLYKPLLKGWHQYEVWVKDSTGRERVETNGFEVYDKVF